jgi:chemosensory pili system protein ChpA (sensor histidine kinase/response regulator)
MMGLGDSAQSIGKLMSAFDAGTKSKQDPAQNPEQGGEPEGESPSRESLLMSLAEQLIQVESVLEEQIATLGEPLPEDQATGFIDLPGHEQRRIHSHLLDECVVSLHQVQDGVRRYLDGDLEADYTGPMEHIAGALDLIGETETAALAFKLRNALGNLLRISRSEADISQDKLETVTDAVAAFELYLAGCRDQQSNRERFLEILQERLGRLPVGEMEVIAEPAPATEAPLAGVGAADPSQSPTVDPELLEVFLEEYESVASQLGVLIPKWTQNQGDKALVTDIRRGFHTLKGSGRMVGAYELGDFAWHIEELLNMFLEGNVEAVDDIAVLLPLVQATLPALRSRLLQEPTELEPEAIEAISQQANSLVAGNAADWEALTGVLPASLSALLPGGAAEPTLKELVCKELAEKLAVLKGLMERISGDRNSTANDDQVLAVHTITGTTALDPIGRESDIARALEGFLVAQRASGQAFNDTAIWAVATSLAHFETCLAMHQGDPEAALNDDEENQIEQLLALAVEHEAVAETREEAVAVPEAQPETAGEAEEKVEVEEIVEPEEGVETEAAEPETEAVDTEILSIFLEEATDILERCDSLLNSWRDKLPDLGIARNLQREIHTFKGGARMSGLNALGNLSHAMETLLEHIAGKLLQPSLSAIDVLEQGCDRLNNWAEQASQGIIPEAGDTLMLFEQQVEALAAVPVQATEETTIDAAPEELLEIPDVELPVSAPESTEEPGEEPAVSQQIRVNADLLDSLVNSAGEISIFRARLEQQVGLMRENLKEFDETVSRLRDQFRKLEIETETQIGSRFQQESPPGSEEFDPLEMDRYSSIQQLSRGLSESVSDLLNLHELLDESARKSEALLVQQSRVSTELQEGLMQTRMVHFGTITPRLRRIIRTAASETRKKARLQLRMTGGGDQLDRNVLERITAPLEHLLRNSVVHGIEKPATRRKLDKPAEGQLTITVAAEATEFVVRVEDDGAGMDLQAIRKRAIELGLMKKSATLPPQQLLQFILHSGFSTSKTVTKLAGRGVGMDVVNNEIKQIGGSVELESEEGKFSRFTIRIPFTLAVMQAIGVTAGEHRYLVPLAGVAGVARILPADYQALLERDKPEYEFAGEPYKILDLEPLLGEPSTPVGDDTVSILMVKSGNLRAAFRVPELLGHREIVVKPVGPHISSVPGILGGTITGDGQVVIIIDAGPLIRQAMLTGARPAPPMENIDFLPQKPLALVVDDSITMRKVTTRVLEGHDFEVITARDGVDAVEQMRDRVPNVLLLDIEMPRMDGYQVAEHVRADARLRHIPIIMITSRAGEKHRERGEKAGADAYLSKPYKESELLLEVEKLLSKEAGKNA